MYLLHLSVTFKYNTNSLNEIIVFKELSPFERNASARKCLSLFAVIIWAFFFCEFVSLWFIVSHFAILMKCYVTPRPRGT